MSTKTLMTVEEFAALPEGDFELVEGELIPLPSASFWHSDIRHNLEFELGAYLRRCRVARVVSETDCRTTEGTVRRPDLSIYMLTRLQGWDRSKVPAPFAPDIAVEVISPSDGAAQLNRKTREYLASGASEVWQIDGGAEQIVIWTKSGVRRLEAADVLETPLLPGFRVPVSALFLTD